MPVLWFDIARRKAYCRDAELLVGGREPSTGPIRLFTGRLSMKEPSSRIPASEIHIRDVFAQPAMPNFGAGPLGEPAGVARLQAAGWRMAGAASFAVPRLAPSSGPGRQAPHPGESGNGPMAGNTFEARGVP